MNMKVEHFVERDLAEVGRRVDEEVASLFLLSFAKVLQSYFLKDDEKVAVLSNFSTHAFLS